MYIYTHYGHALAHAELCCWCPLEKCKPWRIQIYMSMHIYTHYGFALVHVDLQDFRAVVVLLWTSLMCSSFVLHVVVKLLKLLVKV